MKTNKIILLFFALFLTLPCRKDREVGRYTGEFTLTGRVLDEITGQGIPYATVGVMERNREQTSYLGTKTAAAGKTDASGNFSLTFNADTEDNTYELVSYALKYFQKMDGDDVRFTKNGRKDQDIKLKPEGYVTFLIRGNRGGSSLSINRVWGTFYKGADTARTTSVYPNQLNYFTYWVDFIDTSQNYKHMIETPAPGPHDTVTFLIEF